MLTPPRRVTEKESVVDMPPEVRQHFWEWTVPGSTLLTRVRYFQAGTSGPLLLLLHGFGVGAYHYERNMAELSKHCRVYAVDILGQGSSWPVRAAMPEDRLYISVDTWRQQLYDFATSVMGASSDARMYVAGNSLGGLLAVQLGALHPDLVRGLVLLNATPFWSFRPALQEARQGIWGLMPPGFGSVPVPPGLKGFIGRYWWNTLRQPNTVRSMLQLVYSNSNSVDEDTISRILLATEQPFALDIFSAIALAPKPVLDFDVALSRLTSPVLMLYGREDPWVVPMWGQRLKRHLPSAQYLELSPAGHCPHHEVPNTVNWALTSWISSGHQAPVPEGEACDIEESPGRMVKIRHLRGGASDGPSNWLSRLFEWFDNMRKPRAVTPKVQ